MEATRDTNAAGAGTGAGLARLWRSPWRTAAVALLFGGAGAAYAYFVGCHTGTCPLTSNVWAASVYFGVVGAVVGWPGRVR
jgi:hypothetical protein